MMIRYDMIIWYYYMIWRLEATLRLTAVSPLWNHLSATLGGGRGMGLVLPNFSFYCFDLLSREGRKIAHFVPLSRYFNQVFWHLLSIPAYPEISWHFMTYDANCLSSFSKQNSCIKWGELTTTRSSLSITSPSHKWVTALVMVSIY